MSEKIAELNDGFNDISLTKLKFLSIRRFSKKTNKTTKLINNKDSSSYIKGQNRDFGFELLEPVYIHKISISSEGYSSYKSVTFSGETIGNKKFEKKQLINSDGSFDIVINNVIKSFEFKPDKDYKSSPLIKSIEVTGLSLVEFNIAIGEIADIDGYHAAASEKLAGITADYTNKQMGLETVDSELQSLQKEKSELENSVEELYNLIEKSDEDLSEVERNIASIKTEELAVRNRITSYEQNLDKSKNELNELNITIIKNKKTLNSLENDINLFPTDIRGFVEQGASNIQRYLLLSFLPIAALFYVTWYLFDNAAFFSEIYTNLNLSQMFSLLISRLPFVLVSVAIISACYKITSIFVSEIMNINNQRLTLSKISIIAKDVHDSSTFDLNLSESQRYEFRTKLKMDLLKSHLKGDIADDYSYVGSPILQDSLERDVEVSK
ncbi:hypothetical protein [Neptunomonas antarctica]|uniref:Uncharacterized protein n=1 Tax=Neptunomonas antarctica TaxID=619304 RepID=A0A1N7J5K5_9GAMM|nr:hypothetical protein [Neptunomonas antarctica]SIS44527.1 hypothetical protein SAMN05421760_101637 [Neptunomonas antarctica]